MKHTKDKIAVEERKFGKRVLSSFRQSWRCSLRYWLLVIWNKVNWIMMKIWWWWWKLILKKELTLLMHLTVLILKSRHKSWVCWPRETDCSWRWSEFAWLFVGSARCLRLLLWLLIRCHCGTHWILLVEWNLQSTSNFRCILSLSENRKQ